MHLTHVKVFLWVYRFHSKSISLLNWCYRLSIHRGQIKSILNAIRQGEHGHFLQLMYKLIIGILTSSYRPDRGCPLWDFGGNLPWCIGSVLYLQNGVPLLVWIESVVVVLILLYCESINEIEIEIEIENWNIIQLKNDLKMVTCAPTIMILHLIDLFRH